MKYIYVVPGFKALLFNGFAFSLEIYLLWYSEGTFTHDFQKNSKGLFALIRSWYFKDANQFMWLDSHKSWRYKTTTKRTQVMWECQWISSAIYHSWPSPPFRFGRLPCGYERCSGVWQCTSPPSSPSSLSSSPPPPFPSHQKRTIKSIDVNAGEPKTMWAD